MFIFALSIRSSGFFRLCLHISSFVPGEVSVYRDFYGCLDYSEKILSRLLRDHT